MARGATRPFGLAPAALARPAGLGAEWRWAVAVGLAALLLAELPYWLAGLSDAQGVVFGGMIWAAHDEAQYAAAMHEGAASASWLIHDHLTSEPHGPALIYTAYVGLGKLAAALGVNFAQAFHAAGVVARAALLAALYAWCAAVLPSVAQRRLAFVLAVFASGCGVLLGVPLQATGLRSLGQSVEMYLPEYSTFLTLFTAPHLMLALALILLCARCYLGAWERGGARWALLAGLATTGLGLANPFSLVTVCAAIAAHLALMLVRERRLPRGAALAALAVFLAAAPFAAYGLATFVRDPFWGVVYGSQNTQPTPPPGELALGLSAVLVLALVGALTFVRRATPAAWLVLAWIGVSLVLVELPLNSQRRFAFGLHPMLAVLAAAGLEPLLRRLRDPLVTPPGPRRALLVAGLGMALFTSSLVVYAVIVGTLANPGASMAGHYLFQPAALKDVAERLAPLVGPDDVVLAETRTGNYLAGRIDGRVYAGHWTATVRLAEKEAALARFYRGEGGAAARRAFLANNRVRYVVYGPHERALGGPPLSDAFLRPVYGPEEVAIYEVAW